MKIATGMWILLGIVWIGLYWPLLADQVPAFRDAFHFYYPLEAWLDQQAQVGQAFPQFNPLDGTGANLVGEMSSGLFYPGRVLWWLPMLSVAQRMGLVLLLHTIIAGLGAAYAARRMRWNASAQLLASTAYSLSGPLIFQHVNPIYLISAAWLPWALAECCILANGTTTSPAPTATRAVRWPVWIAACSLMLLGGDPQMTFHCGLLMVGALLFSAWSARSIVPLLRGGWRLLWAVIAVSGLTAIQSLPTWHWYRAGLNDLASGQIAVEDNVPALLSDMPSLPYDVARGSPYSYSVAPWHLATMLWSNSLGHFLPQNSRYVAAWSAEPRMWTASLSIGIITLLLALSCLARHRTRKATAYLWLVALFAGTAMLGNYAPVWMLRSALRWLAIDATWLPADEVGGTYWCLAQLIPGYSAFRYPAKWSPIFAISLVLCAAHALHHLDELKTSFVKYLSMATVCSWIVCLLVALFVSLPLHEVFTGWVSGARPDGWLGAIDSSAALRMLIFSSLSSSCVLSLAVLLPWLRRCCPESPSCRSAMQAWHWCLLLLVMIEMSCAARQWLVSIPASQITVALPGDNRAQPFGRFWAGAGRANLLLDRPGATTLADTVAYQQQFMLGKLHLLDGRSANLSAFLTLTPRSLARVRQQLAQQDRLASQDPSLEEALAWLGVQWRLVRNHGLQWQTIENAAPLVELISDRSAENTLHVKYLGASKWIAQVSSPTESRLVMRLFQDGGWQAELRDASGQMKQVKPHASHLGLFQSLELPPGQWDVKYTYAAPGLRTGAILSMLTLVTCLALSVWRVTRRTSNLATRKARAL